MKCVRIASVVALALTAASARADEGMWPFDALPTKTLQSRYGFAPDAAWLDHVRLSSLRFGNGCSASFVSADGLVMTNHHCAEGCLANLSTKKRDLVADGFDAPTARDKRRCPGLGVERLVAIEDVTQRIHEATKGLEGAGFSDALRAETAKIEGACPEDGRTRCEVVTLYSGGRYELYGYRRFDDVRLVFAPEIAIANFGGDPDNFEFPRYDLDVTFLRVYEDGRPYHPKDFLRFSEGGAKAGDLVFTAGNPGSTSRLLTTSQLAYERDHAIPELLVYLSEWRGRLHAFAERSAESARIAGPFLDNVENAVKGLRGRREALVEGADYERKLREESALRAKVAADPELAAEYGDAWERIDAAVKAEKRLAAHYRFVERGRWGGPDGLYSTLFRYARMLVRAAAEQNRPDTERLPEYTTARLPGIRQRLFMEMPFYPSLEIANLTFTLEKLRESLGPDDPVVKEILGKDSPEVLAARLVKGSKLADPKVRRRLFEGGAKAIAASKDPMIRLAARIDPESRAIRKAWEDEVEGVFEKEGTRIAKARFAVEGTGSYPDATFTLRLSYGTVKGWEQDGTQIAPYTTIGGAFERATGQAPFALPASWLKAKKKLDLSTPMNLCSDNDIVGGSSGSPMIDRNGEVVGLVFDGNFLSLGGDYWFDDSVNRAVAVDSRALLESLDEVYGEKRILAEIHATQR